MAECPNCRMPLGKPFACTACGWRAPATYSAQQTELLPRAKRPCDMSREELEEARRIAAPHIAKCKAILRKAAARHDAMPHALTLSHRALAGIDMDPEAIAERKAIEEGL